MPFRRSRRPGPRESAPDWHTYLMATYDRMKQDNPGAMFGDAMSEASRGWSEQKVRLATVRHAVVKSLRKRAKKSPDRKELLERAEHLEVMNAANALKSMRGRH